MTSAAPTPPNPRKAVGFPRVTIAETVRIEGFGLFTGAPAGVSIEPALRDRPPGGIVFVRSGVAIPATTAHLSAVPAHPAFATMPARHTSLAEGDAVVHTVEHILSALAGLGITDAVVRTDGDEIPIGDGSASVFAGPIADAGVRALEGETIAPIVVRSPIRVERDGASVVIEPAGRPEFVYRLEYGAGSPIPSGEAAWSGGDGGGGDSAREYAEAVAPARTFCLQSEAEAMHAAGLFAHLTARDMLVFGSAGPIDNELRFSDEPARHKLLDLIGDLSLVGRPILGRVVATRSGHAMNHEAARRLVAIAGA